MAKRIILISSLPACIVLVSIALIAVGVGKGKPQYDYLKECNGEHIINLHRE